MLGNILLVESICLLSSLFVSIADGGRDGRAFFWSALLTAVVGLFLRQISGHVQSVRFKEALLLVVLSWIVVSFFGALPLWWSESAFSFTDALFESVAGFTTTGVTVIADLGGLSKSVI